MQLNSKYATFHNLDFFFEFNVLNPIIFSALILDTYSMQHLPLISIEKMYTMNNILSRETNMSRPKKKSMFHSVSLMTMKQSLSSKQRRKLNTVAKSRGHGRAKSQLRRSGVSQTRHRKKRTKHDLEIDIKNDSKNWQEFELYHTIESKESKDCFRLDEDMINGIERVNHLTTYTFADVKPKTCKIVDHKVSKFSTRMKCIPECMEEINSCHEDCIKYRCNFQRKTFRPRLISENSIDSEDSCCIVFETESEVNYKSDLEDTDESDIDQSSEDEDTCKEEESILPVQKVKFNLNPVVHIMIQWDYAYRAARRGPWEQMARDRNRFKSRIKCIEHVLNPILTIQHRTHIWQERFALIE
ncbi:protein phosphatase 1 regulatory subunit 15 [Ptiloglossa arizonensis]|uniref:protein phosphatase 1 regulatory subunit 15 n=1 Tax=Ptiloglossa arizonensis TaxID=3350558 RepID=UPI003F9F91D4